MKKLGNEIFIQRGETWSLDFEVKTKKGHPYVLLNTWEDAYLVITVTSARYEQYGDFRKSYWLDMNKRLVEQEDGSFEEIAIKKFINTEPLYVEDFDITDILLVYTDITQDGGDFDITNYLFYTEIDGVNVYKYVTSYDPLEVWAEYSFRIVKVFSTEDWIEQSYLYDIKLIVGETLEDYIYANTLTATRIELPWTTEQTQAMIDAIIDEDIKEQCQSLFTSGQPLVNPFDVKAMILHPSKITVSANIQGGL